jgi:hypothetical protein
MDISLSNIPAAIAGLWFVKLMGWQEYDWLGRRGKRSISDWGIFKNHRMWGGVGYMLFLLNIHFLCGFFLINQLLIPPKHFFPVFRLLLWFGLGNIAYTEGYMDIETWGLPIRKEQPVQGRYRFLCIAVLFTEALLCFKYREGSGNLEEAPTHLLLLFVWALLFGTVVAGWIYLRFGPNKIPKYPSLNRSKTTRERSPRSKRLE